MNPQDPLAELHPLREPALVGWWPPAPGWWLLFALLVALVVFLVYLLWRRHRRNAYRRAAQAKLTLIRADFSENGDIQLCLARVNALLKSVALAAYPRKRVASAVGGEWLEIINNELPPEHHLTPDYINGIYAADAEYPAIESTISAAATWINCHKGQPT